MTAAALTALMASMTLTGSMTAGDLIAAIANFAYGAGLNWLMKRVLVALA